MFVTEPSNSSSALAMTALIDISSLLNDITLLVEVDGVLGCFSSMVLFPSDSGLLYNFRGSPAYLRLTSLMKLLRHSPTLSLQRYFSTIGSYQVGAFALGCDMADYIDACKVFQLVVHLDGYGEQQLVVFAAV